MAQRERRDGFLITSARTPRTKEIKAKERRYLLTMGVRAVALVLGAVLFHGIAQIIAIILAVILPWVAVVAANAAPKISKRTPAPYVPTARVTETPELGVARGPQVVDAEFTSDRVPIAGERVPAAEEAAGAEQTPDGQPV